MGWFYGDEGSRQGWARDADRLTMGTLAAALLPNAGPVVAPLQRTIGATYGAAEQAALIEVHALAVQLRLRLKELGVIT